MDPVAPGAAGSRWMGFLGNLHPGTAHFPIALLTVAAALECVQIYRRRPVLAPATFTLVVIAAGTAVPTAFFGWLLAIYGDTEGSLRELHQWLGIASAGVAVAAAVMARQSHASSRAVWACRALIVIGAGLVLLTGYFGGEMVFGEGHLLKFLRAPRAAGAGQGAGRLVPGAAAQGLGAGPVQFDADIAPIFETSCVKCHGEAKVKAKLRLDLKTRAMQGGKDGVVIVPGDAAKSRLYRALLASDPDDRMPQKADPLPPGQIAAIKEWIDEGAPWPDGVTLHDDEP